ncbi:phosphatase [Rhodobacterales bacterium FZCC0188]|nr:phosphatase [Rhodobacterales bacterium FZCC0188]
MNRLITHAVFDVDGVFTDGKFHYNTDRKVYKIFGAHDSDAIKYLRYNDVDVSAISADERGFEISRARMSDMGIPLTLVPERSRYEFIKTNYDLHSLFFMADGLHDSKVLKAAKVGICPSNGCSFAKSSATYATKRRGGNGAIMEAVEWLAINGYMNKSFDEYLNE